MGLAALLGLMAAAGNLIGGYFVVRGDWSRKYLQYFLALGAGYMLAVAFVEVIPESVRISGEQALLYVLIGFFLVHLFEHTIAPHFHFGGRRTAKRCAITVRATRSYWDWAFTLFLMG